MYGNESAKSLFAKNVNRVGNSIAVFHKSTRKLLFSKNEDIAIFVFSEKELNSNAMLGFQK